MSEAKVDVPAEVIDSIAWMTVELTKIRQSDCKHLIVENFAAELFSTLLMLVRDPNKAFRNGHISKGET